MYFLKFETGQSKYNYLDEVGCMGPCRMQLERFF